MRKTSHSQLTRDSPNCHRQLLFFHSRRETEKKGDRVKKQQKHEMAVEQHSVGHLASIEEASRVTKLDDRTYSVNLSSNFCIGTGMLLSLFTVLTHLLPITYFHCQESKPNITSSRHLLILTIGVVQYQSSFLLSSHDILPLPAVICATSRTLCKSTV